MKNLRKILEKWQEHQSGKNQRRCWNTAKCFLNRAELVQVRCLAVITSVALWHIIAQVTQYREFLAVEILSGYKDCPLRRGSVIWDLKAALSFKIPLCVCHGMSVVSDKAHHQNKTVRRTAFVYPLTWEFWGSSYRSFGDTIWQLCL